jgi:hypothetical protein
MKETLQGQIVVVKDVNGYLLARRLWSVARKGVYVLSDSEWEKRSNGLQSLDPVGFPGEDVFFYPTDNQYVTGEFGELSKCSLDSMTNFFHNIFT